MIADTPSWSRVRTEVCERQGWRCRICCLPDGSRVLGPTGRFYTVFLTVDETRQKLRALCQRCKIHETQETIVSLPVTPPPLPVAPKRSPMQRLRVDLVALPKEPPTIKLPTYKPLLSPECAAWMY